MHSGLLRAWEEQGEFSPLGLEQGERRWVVACSATCGMFLTVGPFISTEFTDFLN